MIHKLLIILCSTILVQAGVIGTDYSAATSVSYSTFSSLPTFTKTIENPTVEKTITQKYVLPESPIYESTFSTQENKYKTDEGSKRRMLLESLNTESEINKYEAITTKDEVSYSAPVYTEALYKSGSYDQESVFPTSIVSTSTSQKSPVYPVLVKSPPTYSIGTSPIIYNTKVTPGLSAYASSSIGYAPTWIKSQASSEDQLKTVTDSETPIVSHVTVSGSGANYSW